MFYVTENWETDVLLHYEVSLFNLFVCLFVKYFCHLSFTAIPAQFISQEAHTLDISFILPRNQKLLAVSGI